MYDHPGNQFVNIETTCGSLLHELQKIWDEIGEPDVERDTMLLDIEQECLAVYRRKVDEAKKCRARLQQAIADAEAEIANICSALGEQPILLDQKVGGNLKEDLKAVVPQLEDMQIRKMERKDQFVEVLGQLWNITNEIFRPSEGNLCKMVVDETDLSVKRLEELGRQLLELQKEKSNRLKQVLAHLNTLNSLCLVLGMDFKRTISEIHPSLDDSKGTKDISNETLEKLAAVIHNLREVKIQRMKRLQDLATALLELWNLMDTPLEEQKNFQDVTSNVAASELEITDPNMLSLNFIKYVDEEVSRLEQLKSSKMKDLVFKKRLDLEEICRKTHMALEGLSEINYSIEAIESGSVDPKYTLEQIELQIAKVKEEAFNRKEILEKVEKWTSACEEECWLEEYNRDGNRYNAGRGAHLTLKRAEKARAAVNKIPAMVEALISKVTAWEKERGIEFLYDGHQLLSILEQYNILRKEKEQERQRQREQKKLQGQLVAEQETLFGSKPSPSKSGRKAPRTSTGVANNRKLSLGGAMLQNLKAEKAALYVHPNKKSATSNQNSSLNYQQYGSSAVHSSGRRDSEIAGHLLKKHVSGAAKSHEIVSPVIRKPLSPVSSALSSKVNIVNFLEDQNTAKKMATPPKSIFAGNEENRTPKMMQIPVPVTPLTLSAPMLMAITPATPCLSYGPKTVESVPAKIEYSFEEVRASFMCSRTHS